jgi:hypothetical protein
MGEKWKKKEEKEKIAQQAHSIRLWRWRWGRSVGVVLQDQAARHVVSICHFDVFSV